MAKNIVHVVGTGTIGEPLVGLLCDHKEALGVDEISFSKKQALLTDRSKVNALLKRGAKFCADQPAMDEFKKIGIEPSHTFEEALERASVVIDCTPVGNANKAKYYERYASSGKGFIAQGSEFGFGKMYARGINDEVLRRGEDRFLQVVSCNTHNLSVLIKTLAMDNGNDLGGLESAQFVCIRRSNDISQDADFIPAHQVNRHKDARFGTHHAHDAHELFKTMGLDLNLFSSAIKTNTQYMHTVWFHLKLKSATTKEALMKRVAGNDRIALTHKNSSNSVFSFGRDHGHYGRILNQTVLAQSTLDVIGGKDVYGWCFTPQDGNSLLSSISATAFFLHPEDYEKRIQCLKPYFFDEV